MYINPKTEIAGLPSLRIRELMRKGAGVSMTLSSIACTADSSEERAKDIIDSLIHLGYLEPRLFPFSNEDQCFFVTELGQRLALASAAKALTRKTAESLVAKVLERADLINEDSGYVYRIEEIVVFGSYIDRTREQLNDVDLGIKLVPRFSDEKQQWETYIKRIHTAGRSLNTVFHRVTWPTHEIYLKLKSRSRVSLHDYKEVLDLECPYETIYKPVRVRKK